MTEPTLQERLRSGAVALRNYDAPLRLRVTISARLLREAVSDAESAADALDKAEQREAAFDDAMKQHDWTYRQWKRLFEEREKLEARIALAERLAEAVERHIGEDLGGDEDLIDPLSAFRESEKKG